MAEAEGSLQKPLLDLSSLRAAALKSKKQQQRREAAAAAAAAAAASGDKEEGEISDDGDAGPMDLGRSQPSTTMDDFEIALLLVKELYNLGAREDDFLAHGVSPETLSACYLSLGIPLSPQLAHFGAFAPQIEAPQLPSAPVLTQSQAFSQSLINGKRSRAADFMAGSQPPAEKKRRTKRQPQRMVIDWSESGSDDENTDSSALTPLPVNSEVDRFLSDTKKAFAKMSGVQTPEVSEEDTANRQQAKKELETKEQEIKRIKDMIAKMEGSKKKAAKSASSSAPATPPIGSDAELVQLASKQRALEEEIRVDRHALAHVQRQLETTRHHMANTQSSMAAAEQETVNITRKISALQQQLQEAQQHVVQITEQSEAMQRELQHFQALLLDSEEAQDALQSSINHKTTMLEESRLEILAKSQVDNAEVVLRTVDMPTLDPAAYKSQIEGPAAAQALHAAISDEVAGDPPANTNIAMAKEMAVWSQRLDKVQKERNALLKDTRPKQPANGRQQAPSEIPTDPPLITSTTSIHVHSSPSSELKVSLPKPFVADKKHGKHLVDVFAPKDDKPWSLPTYEAPAILTTEEGKARQEDPIVAREIDGAAVDLADRQRFYAFRYYKPYWSPLRHFRSCRLNKNYPETYAPYNGWRSLTFCHRIDPFKMLCRYESAGGICNDDRCKGSHFKEWPLVDWTDDDDIEGKGAVDTSRKPRKTNLLVYREGGKNIMLTYLGTLVHQMRQYTEGDNRDQREQYQEDLEYFLTKTQQMGTYPDIDIAKSIMEYRTKYWVRDPTRIVCWYLRSWDMKRPDFIDSKEVRKDGPRQYRIYDHFYWETEWRKGGSIDDLITWTVAWYCAEELVEELKRKVQLGPPDDIGDDAEYEKKVLAILDDSAKVDELVALYKSGQLFGGERRGDNDTESESVSEQSES